MEVLYESCAGLDVHKDTVVACLRCGHGKKVTHEVRTFGTITGELVKLAAWLAENKCTHIAMEATGVYWKPVWHILDDGTFELLLANPMHVKNVPGRKTDVNDATWLSDLLAHGLIGRSFVPPEPIQELRSLTRTRKQFVREKSRHVQRLQKTLEDANIKVSSVISDLMGKSGRAFLRALIAGDTDPEKLADLGSGRLRSPRKQLVESLRGKVTANHRVHLKLHLNHIEAIEDAIVAIDSELQTLLVPYADGVERLKTIPGVGQTAAQVLIAEIGADMSRFPNVGHLISWAGLCPRNDESAGKRRSRKTRKSALWLKDTLVECAWAASNKKGSYLKSQFLRLRSRRGPKKAVVAVAASILTAAYHMLRDGSSYKDLGPHHFDKVDKNKTARTLLRKLKDLGYQVEVKVPAP
jgi:transposase